MKKTILYSLTLLSLLLFNCSSNNINAPTENGPLSSRTFISGVTLVAPPSPFENNPMPRLDSVGAAWISLIPYGFTRSGQTKLSYNLDRQWWGEKLVGIKESVHLAHKSNIKVMLKPQVYIPGNWIGDFKLNSNEEWLLWEAEYKNYIMSYALLAEEMGVEMLCIGTEMRQSVKLRPEFWLGLIASIKEVYTGKLTYSANWDSYNSVHFWDQLDYIGLSAYFPLSEEKTPKVSDLLKKWKTINSELEDYSKNHQKQILFTEYGYLSVDGCAGKTWELEKNISNLKINELAQANSIGALLANFTQQEWWAGGFLWKWFPNMQGHEGYPEKDYTPQDKQAEKVLSKYYSKH